MSESSINDVANYLIQQNESGITHRELQKILYFSQGFYLAKYGEPLFNASMDAWAFGPVNSDIWGRFREFGYLNLKVSSDASTDSLNDVKKLFLSSMLTSFLILGESTLIDMSHSDYPWERNYIAGINQTIEMPLIEDYFKNFDDHEQYIDVAKEKVEFSRLLFKRKEYLSLLPNIGEDWISGGSVAPSEDICSACKQFLHSFKRRLFSLYAKPDIPNILMGPIPTGGVGIELHLQSKNLYLHFHNNKEVEVSIEVDGAFKEYETSLDEFNEEIGLFLEREA